VIENITGEDLDVSNGGFLCINLTTGGNQSTPDDTVEGKLGFPLLRNVRFSNVRMKDVTTFAVRQSILGAQPAYALFDAKDRLGVNYAKHGHAFTAEDWTAMMDFFDKHLRGKKIDHTFDRFPAE
jgi:hypothetical protein